MNSALRQIGRDLADEWNRQRKFGAESYKRHIAYLAERMPMLSAVVQYNRGNKTAITEFLRSDRPLTSDDRETLAQFLEGKFDHEKKVGAPKGNVRWVAMTVRKFLSEWKEIAVRADVKTYGQTADMTAFAIDYVLTEVLPDGVQVLEDAVWEQLKRSKSRQN